MSRRIFMTGGVLGVLAIVLGAFAAHGLTPRLTFQSMQSFETGVKYQMYMALFLLVLGFVPGITKKIRLLCFYLTVAGVVLFSGSIYFLATNSLTSFDFTVIAMATPTGGILLIAAWIALLVGFSKLKKK